METHDRLTNQMNGMAAEIDVDDPAEMLAAVRGTAAGRARRRSIVSGVAGAAAGAVLLIGGVVVYQGLEDDGTDTIAIDEGDSDAASSDRADTEASAGEPPLDATVSTRAVERVEVTPTSFTIGADQSDALSNGVEWIVPWQDGFLAARFVGEPPTLVTSELLALLSQDARELIDVDTTIPLEEAMNIWDEAGLLPEVLEILRNNETDAVRSLDRSIYSDSVDVVFSTDGDVWESVDVVLPEGVEAMYGVRSTGTRLAFATTLLTEAELEAQSDAEPDGAVWRAEPPQGTNAVVSTTDLVNWEVIEIADGAPSANLSDGLRFEEYIGSVAINETGWMVPFSSFVDIDIEAVVPAEVRERLERNGFDTEYDEQGVTFQIYDNGAFGPEGSSDMAEPVPVETLIYTWDELGIDPTLLLEGQQGSESRLVTAAWGGDPVDAAPVPGVSAFTSTADGFYVLSGSALRFSVDGAAWTAIPLPAGIDGAQSIVALGDGVVAFANAEQGGTTVLYLDDPASDWERLEIPGAPSTMFAAAGEGSSTAVLVAAAEGANVESIEFTVEVDGYTLLLQTGRSTIRMTLTDSTGEIITDEEVDFSEGGQPATWRDSAAGLEFIDVESGEVIVTFPERALDAAASEQVGDLGIESDSVFDYWMLATLDAQRWLVIDIEESTDGFLGDGGIAANGNTVVVQNNGAWERYELD